MKTSLTVQNLKCGGCAKTIISKLATVKTITAIDVDLNHSIISFTAQNNEAILFVKQKLKSLGYPTLDDTNGVLSKAKSFVSCAVGKMK